MTNYIKTIFDIDFGRLYREHMAASGRQVKAPEDWDGRAERGIDKVRAIRKSWEDDWSDVPVCDVAVASRSTAVLDLEAALKKLDAHARKRACLTSKVGGYFIDPDIAAVIGRRLDPVPDYIYAVNILYQMGRQPRVDFLENDHRPTDCESSDEFVRRVGFSLGQLSDDEGDCLAAWFDENPDRARASGRVFRWAFIASETT